MPALSEAQQKQFRDEGYCILERVIPEDLLALLRDECQGFIDAKNAEMDRLGTDTVGISHRHKRYFIANCLKQRPVLADFMFSEIMAEICRATLGDEAYLFHDQYVVKGGEGGMKFAWHQDSGYVNFNGGDPGHRPYLTCWCPLDDVGLENGTVYLLPYSQSGIRTAVQHLKEPDTNDLVGYFGSARGIPVEVMAGSIAVFTSYVFHSSGANHTDALRRVFLAQYSSEPIMAADRSRVWGNAIPFLHAGERVSDRLPETAAAG